MKIVATLFGFPVYADDDFPKDFAIMANDRGAVIIKLPTAEEEETTEKTGKRGPRHCSRCDGTGHQSNKCPNITGNVDTDPEKESFTSAITPDKLEKTKKWLAKGWTIADVADKVGLSDEQVTNIASSLGL